MNKINIKSGSQILDIGTGTGILLPFLKEKADQTTDIIALDLSFNMLKQVREKFAESFPLIHSDISVPPLKINSFDTAICFNTFPHFTDKSGTFRKVFNLLKLGGTFHVAHSASREDINALHRDVGGIVREDRIPEDEKMSKLFQDAGFADILIDNNKEYYLASGIRNET